MATWAEFLAAAGELGPLAAGRLAKSGVVLLATVPGTGWPRISRVDGIVVDGEYLLAVPKGFRAAADLARDPRCAVHTAGYGTADGPDLALVGRVRSVGEDASRAAYAAGLQAVTGRPEGDDRLVGLDLAEVVWSSVDEPPVRHTWNDPTVRRGRDRRATLDLARFERGEPERRDLWRDRRREPDQLE